MANSPPKSNDTFVEIHGFLFGDGERLVSLKLHYPILRHRRRSPHARSTPLPQTKIFGFDELAPV
jgi:hypothetical protein